MKSDTVSVRSSRSNSKSSCTLSKLETPTKSAYSVTDCLDPCQLIDPTEEKIKSYNYTPTEGIPENCENLNKIMTSQTPETTKNTAPTAAITKEYLAAVSTTKNENESIEANFVEKVTEKIEYLLTAFGTGTKPWYCTASQIYALVKEAAAMIPNSDKSLDVFLNVIVTTTLYLNSATKEKVPILSEGKCRELIEKLDAIIAELGTRIDDGCDERREQVSVYLKKLVKSIAEHLDMMMIYMDQKCEDLKEHVDVLSKTISEKVATTLDNTNKLLEKLKEKYPDSYARIMDTSSTVQSHITSASTSVQSASSSAVVAIGNTPNTVLTAAQPYVQNATAKVVDISEPYMEKVTPYLAPYWSKAVPYVEKAQESKYINPYVPYVTKAMDVAKQYAFVQVQ